MGFVALYGTIDVLSGLVVGYLSLTGDMPTLVTFAALLLLAKGLISIGWDV